MVAPPAEKSNLKANISSDFEGLLARCFECDGKPTVASHGRLHSKCDTDQLDDGFGDIKGSCDSSPTIVELQNMVCNLELKNQQLEAQHQIDLRNSDAWTKLYMLLSISVWDRMDGLERATLFETGMSRKLLERARQYVSVRVFNYKRSVIEDVPSTPASVVNHDELGSHDGNETMALTRLVNVVKKGDNEQVPEPAIYHHPPHAQTFAESGGKELLREVTDIIVNIKAEQASSQAQAQNTGGETTWNLADFASAAYIRMVQAEEILLCYVENRARPVQYQTLAGLAASFLGLDEREILQDFRDEMGIDSTALEEEEEDDEVEGSANKEEDEDDDDGGDDENNDEDDEGDDDEHGDGNRDDDHQNDDENKAQDDIQEGPTINANLDDNNEDDDVNDGTSDEVEMAQSCCQDGIVNELKEDDEDGHTDVPMDTNDLETNHIKVTQVPDHFEEEATQSGLLTANRPEASISCITNSGMIQTQQGFEEDSSSSEFGRPVPTNIFEGSSSDSAVTSDSNVPIDQGRTTCDTQSTINAIFQLCEKDKVIDEVYTLGNGIEENIPDDVENYDDIPDQEFLDDEDLSIFPPDCSYHTFSRFNDCVYEVPGAKDDSEDLYGSLDGRKYNVMAGGFPALNHDVWNEKAGDHVPQYTEFVRKDYAMMSGALPEGPDGYPDPGFVDDLESSSDESSSRKESQAFVDGSDPFKCMGQNMGKQTASTLSTGKSSSDPGSIPTIQNSTDAEAPAIIVSPEAAKHDMDATTNISEKDAELAKKRAAIEKAVKAAREAQSQLPASNNSAAPKAGKSSIAATAKTDATTKGLGPGLSRAERRAADRKKTKALEKQLRKKACA